MHSASSETVPIVEACWHLDAGLAARADGGDEAAFETIMRQHKTDRTVALDERPGIDTPMPLETLMERSAPATEAPDSQAERTQLRRSGGSG